MRKLGIVVFSFTIFSLLIPLDLSAESLIVLNPDWVIKVNVLAAQDQLALSVPTPSDLQIHKVSEASTDVAKAKISLYRVDSNIKMALETAENKTNLDVTDYKDNLIEVEETPEKQRLKISLAKDNFQVEQGGIKVTTKYPIEIDPTTKKISLKTESGNKYLSILPKEASNIALQSKTFTTFDQSKSNELIESEGVLVYKLTGSKKINLFNVTDYNVEVESHINASNGEIVFTNEAVWVKLLSFFLK